ncbi:MAG: hypothetical protein K5867_01855 [Bacteroidales bacterium]|nr:hypothetical protein [Bacteroidales bacterium]
MDRNLGWIALEQLARYDFKGRDEDWGCDIAAEGLSQLCINSVSSLY